VENVTLLAPETRASSARGVSSMLPPDLLEQVRRRVGVLALLLCIGFGIDPFLVGTTFVAAKLAHVALPPDALQDAWVQVMDGCAALGSAALWWISRRRTISASRLHTVGLIYEIVVCFEIELGTMWQHYSRHGILPNLTWAPAVIILFPLILPGPPRRMLAAAIVAGLMSPLALLVMQLSGKAMFPPGMYVDATIRAGVAVLAAAMGARVVYRLSREVVAARQLGSYQLEEPLGSGGMGEVWRARHRMLARPAAVKLIRPSANGGVHGSISAEAARRFELEAQAIAKLRSPHTVNLFDFGIAEGGAFYYAMELLEGLDADRFVRRFGPLPAERVVYLLRQICHSLSEAEASGLVHRDIKPANIFLCHYGEDFDFVKVLDFGLVKALDEPREPQHALTRENVVQGTPEFIAPEQALGNAVVDARADLYATGCVAYWFLTGQLVFRADTPMGMLLHHANTAPTPPSVRTELPIPPALDRIVMACLSKDPTGRPQSARELSRLLGEVRGGDEWTAERAREWWLQHQPTQPPA
jgi:eukaryotic-like serine/threonine-protein kinase